MPEKKKLEEAAPSLNRIATDESDIRERELSTLLNNDLVAGNLSIAEKILRSAKRLPFKKGDKVIMQGAPDDCAYFIISGSVDIRINGKHIDFRCAPQAVGEMAAKRAGEVRTADVVVASEILEALALSGSEFRAIMRAFETFSDNLNNSIDALSRKKISQLGVKSEPRGWSWTAISGGVGLAAALAGSVFVWLAGYSPLQIALASAILGIAAFIIIILSNPIYLYRKLSISSGTALVLYIVYGALSYSLTINGTELGIPYIDFQAHGEQKIETLVLSIVGLGISSITFGYLDLRLNGRDVKSQ
ncbi:cyclic nucleotide-binding domain-containing protein [Loktanella sp. M215]|uniref:cyclic nucleotide-binding domain-containing protein n=1 Tax=Loktanella sp. M215 TaxID=2675431 RepID=UPI001F1F093A|nr:cyclic nucleotide-binding domain-containing protein [Loktanella sp. M215]MCF7699926.1 cyclic nucleotide-binding domain-containing protein [Loktanella sp. M215]